MELTYRVQIILSVVIVILANILTDYFGSWVYRSLGFCICGLCWLAHPVLPKGVEATRQTVRWTRIAGVILILIGIFTRVQIS